MLDNILERVPERKWNSRALRNCFKIFNLLGIEILAEHRQCPTVKHVFAEMKAGKENWRDLLKTRQEAQVPPPGFLLWHLLQEDEKEATCYFAKCSGQDWADINHAATCGCDGCWGRMNDQRSQQ